MLIIMLDTAREQRCIELIASVLILNSCLQYSDIMNRSAITINDEQSESIWIVIYQNCLIQVLESDN